MEAFRREFTMTDVRVEAGGRILRYEIGEDYMAGYLFSYAKRVIARLRLPLEASVCQPSSRKKSTLTITLKS